jgi:fused signal recognition particle receptor
LLSVGLSTLSLWLSSGIEKEKVNSMIETLLEPFHGDAGVFALAVAALILALLLVWTLVRLTKKKRPARVLPPLKEPFEAGPRKPARVEGPEGVPQTSAAGATAEAAARAPAEIADLAAVDLRKALRKTEENIFGRIRSLFGGQNDLPHMEEIEEILYTSDLGPQTVQKLMAGLEELSHKDKADFEKVRETLKSEMQDVFSKLPVSELNYAAEGPTVFMIVGVNGAGKTTSIGKLSSQLALQGKRVLVAAGDTFRAAAGGQLKAWTERAQVEIFSPEGVTDPSAVAFDAVTKGKAQNYDVVIIDTAGRLHTQANLMEELKKMKRVMGKVIPEAPHEVIIVLDANSGQNALMQAREYNNALGLTGAILTKMDGTAKGGVAVGLANELQIPIKFIGVGERIQDLRTFSPQEFVESIFA